MHAQIIKAIRQEGAHAKAGQPAAIIAKMNSLLEPEVIQALYEASCAGVKIDLIVRGVCALRPGVPGVSENIRVRSVIGRFLEHTRIFYFRNSGVQDVYLASADWMHRNLFRRIEVAFPVLDARLKKRVIKEGLEPYLKDNVQTWEMDADGVYRRKVSRRAKPVSAQGELLALMATRLS
jgi:polyphosphate kinase